MANHLETDQWLCTRCQSQDDDPICDTCWAVLQHRLRRHVAVESHPEVTQDQSLTTRLINAFWAMVG